MNPYSCLVGDIVDDKIRDVLRQVTLHWSWRRVACLAVEWSVCETTGKTVAEVPPTVLRNGVRASPVSHPSYDGPSRTLDGTN